MKYCAIDEAFHNSTKNSNNFNNMNINNNLKKMNGSEIQIEMKNQLNNKNIEPHTFDNYTDMELPVKLSYMDLHSKNHNINNNNNYNINSNPNINYINSNLGITPPFFTAQGDIQSGTFYGNGTSINELRNNNYDNIQSNNDDYLFDDSLSLFSFNSNNSIKSNYSNNSNNSNYSNNSYKNDYTKNIMENVITEEIVRPEEQIMEDSVIGIKDEIKESPDVKYIGVTQQCNKKEDYKNNFYPQYVNMKPDAYIGRYTDNNVNGFDSNTAYASI